MTREASRNFGVPKRKFPRSLRRGGKLEKTNFAHPFPCYPPFRPLFIIIFSIFLTPSEKRPYPVVIAFL